MEHALTGGLAAGVDVSHAADLGKAALLHRHLTHRILCDRETTANKDM